ncbi:MAG: hypothetical protein BGN88_05720 [Clostridiales bacterium 43-6]|nr:MAG: hypothetical protein BGN88_05720 [Clostridiales bacterium 43-6]
MATKRKRRSLESKQRTYGYFFTAPFILGAIIFILYPLYKAIEYAFSRELKLDDITYRLTAYDFPNFDHVTDLFLKNISFRQDLVSSLINMAINVPIVVFFAFFMASVLNTKFRGRGFARAIMFLPVIIASGIIVYLGQNDLAAMAMSSTDRFAATQTSAMNVSSAFSNMLTQMDFNSGIISFLTKSVDRIYEITIMSAVSIVIFLAGLQGISPSIFEASYIEGATKWEVFWKITFPMVSPLILLSVIYSIVDAFTDMRNKIVFQIHDGITSAAYDTATAKALVYSVLIIIVLAIVGAILSRRVFYYD